MTPRRFVVALALFSVCSHVLIHLSAPQLAEVTHRHRRIAKAAAAPALPQSTESPPPPPPLSSLLPPSAAEACSGHHLSVLIVHEHHLKSIGSDLRLMGVLLQLRQLGHSVSFLFRGAVPRSQRSPLTPELARLIGMPDPTNTFEALVLRGGGKRRVGLANPPHCCRRRRSMSTVTWAGWSDWRVMATLMLSSVHFGSGGIRRRLQPSSSCRPSRHIHPRTAAPSSRCSQTTRTRTRR